MGGSLHSVTACMDGHSLASVMHGHDRASSHGSSLHESSKSVNPQLLPGICMYVSSRHLYVCIFLCTLECMHVLYVFVYTCYVRNTLVYTHDMCTMHHVQG